MNDLRQKKAELNRVIVKYIEEYVNVSEIIDRIDN